MIRIDLLTSNIEEGINNFLKAAQILPTVELVEKTREKGCRIFSEQHLEGKAMLHLSLLVLSQYIIDRRELKSNGVWRKHVCHPSPNVVLISSPEL